MDQEKHDQIIANIKNIFNITYKGKKSQSYRDIYREVYGDDYPEEANPDSFVTVTELQNFARYLDVGPEQTFIDLACGRGGPGMWIARKIGANYVGFELSETAIKVAEQRVTKYGLEKRASFHVGNICSINLPSNSFDGAISIDALIYIPDLLAAIFEVARILRSNAKFVFTSWEYKKSKKGLDDYRPFLQKAGFKIEIYNEAHDWERKQREICERVLKSKKLLIKEMGRKGAFSWIMDAKINLPLLKQSSKQSSKYFNFSRITLIYEILKMSCDLFRYKFKNWPFSFYLILMFFSFSVYILQDLISKFD